MIYHDTDTEAFVMDDLGNRTGDQTLRADGTVNFAVDSTTNRYTSIGGEPIAHDAAGNMTGDKDGYAYSYDYENRIVKIEDLSSSTVATFEYDALGRRIRKADAVASTTTLYYYDPDWRCLEERDGSDILQRSFIYGNYIDEVLVMTVPGSPPPDYYYLQDHLYSPAALLAANGAVVERYEYDAYGTVHVMDASYGSRTTSSYGNPYTFTGRRLDLLDSGALEMMYYRHRSYGPYVGRFLQHDPLDYQDCMNLYAYVRDHPSVGVDPYGLWYYTQECLRVANDASSRCITRDGPTVYHDTGWMDATRLDKFLVYTALWALTAEVPALLVFDATYATACKLEVRITWSETPYRDWYGRVMLDYGPFFIYEIFGTARIHAAIYRGVGPQEKWYTDVTRQMRIAWDTGGKFMELPAARYSTSGPGAAIAELPRHSFNVHLFADDVIIPGW